MFSSHIVLYAQKQQKTKTRIEKEKEGECVSVVMCAKNESSNKKILELDCNIVRTSDGRVKNKRVNLQYLVAFGIHVCLARLRRNHR